MKKILFAASFLGVVSLASFAGAREAKTNTKAQNNEAVQAVRHVTLPRTDARTSRNLQHTARISSVAPSGNGGVNVADKRIRHAEQVKAYEAYKAAH